MSKKADAIFASIIMVILGVILLIATITLTTWPFVFGVVMVLYVAVITGLVYKFRSQKNDDEGGTYSPDGDWL